MTGVGDMCGSVSGTNAWCMELISVGCLASADPHYVSLLANNLPTNEFYADLPGEDSIDGDLGAAVTPPLTVGDAGAFEVRSGPDYLRAFPNGDGLVRPDIQVTAWCAGGACAPACGGAYCSATADAFTAKPEFTKRDTGSGATLLSNIADDAVPATGEWSWDTTNKRIIVFDDPAAATMSVTLNGNSEQVCVELLNACDERITFGEWHDDTVDLTLSQAPDSGKDIVSNNADGSTMGFDNMTVPAAGLADSGQLTIKGDLNKGLACMTITAEAMPSDDPKTPIKITPAFYGTPALGLEGGSSMPAFVLISPNIGIASGTTSFAGVSDVEDIWVPGPGTATSAITLSPAWSKDGGRIAFNSLQTNPCDGNAAVGTSPYDSFNIYAMSYSGGTWTDCIRITRNSTDGVDKYGVSPHSEVTWSTTNDRLIFSARDMELSGMDKLFWVSATATAGSATGTQYNYPPTDPSVFQDSLMVDASPGDATLTVTLASAFSVGQEILIGEMDFSGNMTKYEVRTITAIDAGANQIGIAPTMGTLIQSFGGLSSGVVQYHVTLRELGQSMVPLTDGSSWIDPDWAPNDAACNATYRDAMLAVRIPSDPTEDLLHFAGGSVQNTIDPNSPSTNANIVLISGAKDSNNVYKLRADASNVSDLSKVTDFDPADGIYPLKPKWSPDCSMIAFLAWDRLPTPDPPSKTSVYIINLNNNTAGWASASLPVTSLSDTGVYQVYDYDDYNMPAYYPAWSADSTIVSYSVDTNNQLDLLQVNSSFQAVIENLFYNDDL